MTAPPIFSVNATFASDTSEKARRFSQLHGVSPALLVAEHAESNTGLTLLITNSSESAAKLGTALNFFAPDLEVLSFPDWETLPYDNFSPHQDIISERIYTLYQLQQRKANTILVVPAATLMQRLAPKSYLTGSALILEIGQKLNSETLRSNLTNAGYHAVDTVYEHGEFAIRGSIIDIFPMGTSSPLRIDLFDDEIDTLRTFDPETQRSIEQIDSINLLPAKEFPLDKTGTARFRQAWRGQFDVDPRHCPTYQDVSDGIAPAGIEYYLPLFFEETAMLLDYIPSNAHLFSETHIDQSCQEFWKEINERYESRRYDIERPLLAPHLAFHPVDTVFAALKAFTRTELIKEAHEKSEVLATQPPQELPVDAKASNPLANVEAFINNYDGRILFCAESPGRREALLELLNRIKQQPKTVKTWHEFRESSDALNIIVAPIEEGLSLNEPKIEVITESQLFGQRVMQRRRRGNETDNSDLIFRNLTELQEGAPVVHEQHGVGRYLGLQTLDLDGEANEFLTLEYSDGAKLYVPVAALHLISRYSGANDTLAPLHKLGTDQWSKAKRKAMEKIRDTAAELLDIYARRAAKKGRVLTSPEDQYLSFASGFPFEETPDQEKAILAVIKDMGAKTPMDRLVCGDVGFGKTEVALRAAFIAVQSGHQVAVLAPTTLLAQQHYQTFIDRFADWPINVQVMSRFKTGKEQKSTISGLESGNVDIVIGTHKLLHSDMNFKSLGLLIIDEEHRFGVQQKEKLKTLRSDLDILALTATPIPRTLNMSMAGIRDLSIIATPPARRLSVNTFVREKEKGLIKEAILRELLRGGQVYFLHNEVKTIQNLAKDIGELVPEARIAVGHGQMRERELEQVMSDFYHKRFNVLICTTIIETGIDVPNANTIIIERADKFGLAQLHQLRGRVGRSHHQAYAYLLTPNKKAMTADAMKRLEAIEAASDLGAGFTLATHDLEIRGAGELLGEEQSGQMQTIGFSLYMELLEEAIDSIKAGKTPSMERPLHEGTEVNLRISALIPDDYLPDVHNRLILYKRIASAKSGDELRELQVEMIDRFGLLPEPVKNLFRVTLLKLKAETIGIKKIDAGTESGRFEFEAETKVNPLSLVKMVQAQPQKYGLEGSNRLKFNLSMETNEKRFQAIESILQQLTVEEPA